MWSEFGRRPEENGSGTDHGAARLRVRDRNESQGQMVGEFPGLATLDDDDNLHATSDFRAVYCSLLEQWLGDDAAPVIPGASVFARPCSWAETTLELIGCVEEARLVTPGREQL